jgi:hypothetical protein
VEVRFTHPLSANVIGLGLAAARRVRGELVRLAETASPRSGAANPVGGSPPLTAWRRRRWPCW